MKKAQMRTVIVMIIACAITIFLFAQGVDVGSWITKEKHTRLCTLSIETAYRSKLGKLPKGFVSNRLECPRRYVTFYKDKIEAKIVEDKVELDPKYKELNEEIIKRGIAEETVGCWDMVGRGRYNPFDVGVITDSDSACIMCSIISFDEDVQKTFQNKKITGFNEEYLKNNHLLHNKKIKYHDFLQVPLYAKERETYFYFKLKKVGDQFALDSVGEIDPTKTYYLIYVGYRESAIHKHFVEDFKDDIRYWFGIDIEQSKKELGRLFLIEDKDLETVGCGFLYN